MTLLHVTFQIINNTMINLSIGYHITNYCFIFLYRDTMGHMIECFLIVSKLYLNRLYIYAKCPVSAILLRKYLDYFA